MRSEPANPHPVRPARRILLAGLCCLLALVGCDRDEPDRVVAPPDGGQISGVVGDPHIVPGPAFPQTLAVTNPYAGDDRAAAEGQRLYTWYNCGGCHGELGGGGMGPPLRDDDWIYGGDEVSIFESIMEGRPEGMPSWQGKIPADQGWMMVAYIQSLPEQDWAPTLTPPEDRTPPFPAFGGGSESDDSGSGPSGEP